MLVSAAFLGWPFALFKLAAAFLTGLIGGSLVSRLTAPDLAPSTDPALASDLVIYLGTVIVMSILFGLLFDGLLQSPGLPGQGGRDHH